MYTDQYTGIIISTYYAYKFFRFDDVGFWSTRHKSSRILATQRANSTKFSVKMRTAKKMRNPLKKLPTCVTFSRGRSHIYIYLPQVLIHTHAYSVLYREIWLWGQTESFQNVGGAVVYDVLTLQKSTGGMSSLPPHPPIKAALIHSVVSVFINTCLSGFVRHDFCRGGNYILCTYFSTCIVCFSFLWFCCRVLFGSGSLNVKNETVFIYIY